MIIDSPIISGSYLSTGSLSQTGNVSITGSLTATAGITGSFSGSGADLFGIPATGKSVDVIGCTIATIIGGKITEERDFFDNLEFFKQLGIKP